MFREDFESVKSQAKALIEDAIYKDARLQYRKRNI